MVILPSNIINHGWDANVDSENADPLSPIRNVCYGYVFRQNLETNPYFNLKLSKYALSFLPDMVDFENLINKGSILNPTGGENGPSPIFVNATARTVYSW